MTILVRWLEKETTLNWVRKKKIRSLRKPTADIQELFLHFFLYTRHFFYKVRRPAHPFTAFNYSQFLNQCKILLPSICYLMSNFGQPETQHRPMTIVWFTVQKKACVWQFSTEKRACQSYLSIPLNEQPIAVKWSINSQVWWGAFLSPRLKHLKLDAWTDWNH